MKKIECVIRPVRLESVKAALAEKGLTGMTVLDVRGAGRGGGVTEMFGDVPYTVSLPPKIKIEILARDEDVDEVIETVRTYARTGEVGDGKIFVLPADNAIRIRTGDDGEGVL